MSFFLFRHLYRKYKNRDGPEGPSGSKEQKKRKEVPLCEHQLAASTDANNDGVLSEKSPSTDHQQIPNDQRGRKHCAQCIAEEKRASHYRWKIILSLLIPNMMATMDLTIIATALPTIASHFSNDTSHNWQSTG
jgi:hypothetical protein